MENIGTIVANNLKRLREGKKMSLDAVAKVSGVSKSMLGQIERGDVNPTLSTVWKIANGLKVSFTELMTRPEMDFEVIRREEVEPVTGDGGRYRNFPMFPFDGERRFEIYYIEMDPASHLEAEPHPDGTQEFVTAFSGALTVCVDNHELAVESGSSLRFKADRPHSYRNTSDEICRLSMVIYYPR